MSPNLVASDNDWDNEHAAPLLEGKHKDFPFKRLQCTFNNIMYSLIAILLIMAIIITIIYGLSGASMRENCGDSPSEARSLGCIFDVMEFAWLPARCLDRELTDEFRALRDWQWFLDRDATQLADAVAVTEGFYDEVYVTQEYHLYHCTYMWRKMHRAVLTDGFLDGYLADTHHTAHCELQLREYGRLGPNDTSTSIYTKYADCPWDHHDMGRWGWYRMIGTKRVHRNP